jgi:hypothetical protein
MNDAKFDSKRRLCPDGSCIGVVGDDGRCKVCGRDAGGGAKSGGAKSAAAPATGVAAVSEATTDESDLDSGSSDSDDNDVVAADAAEPGALSFDPARRLCSDGNCIGLIGPNGNCNVCGQPASE